MSSRSPLLRHDLLAAFDDNATGGVRCRSAVQAIGAGGRVLDDGSLVHTDSLARLGLELGTCPLQLFNESRIYTRPIGRYAQNLSKILYKIEQSSLERFLNYIL